MTTLTDLVGQVRNLIGDEQSVRWSDTVIINMMIDAQKQLARVRRNTFKTATIGVTTGILTPLPSDFIALVALRQSATGNPIWPVDARQIRNLRKTTSDTPNYYYIQAQTLAFWPNPLSFYNVEIDYIGWPTLATVGANSPDASLGPEVDQYLKAYALRELNLAAENYEGFTIHQAIVAGLESSMMSSLSNSNAFEYPIVHDDEMQRESGGPIWLD